MRRGLIRSARTGVAIPSECAEGIGSPQILSISRSREMGSRASCWSRRTSAGLGVPAPALSRLPDNLKSGVVRACRYEPTLQRDYEELALHYGAAIVPARPYKPRADGSARLQPSWCGNGGPAWQ